MVWCCVPSCKSQQGRNKAVSFHEFPANASAKEKWLGNIVDQKRSHRWTPTERDKVCSRHFVDTDFSMSTTKRRLLPHAVPSQFLDASADTAQRGLKQQPKLRDSKPAISKSQKDNAEDLTTLSESYQISQPQTVVRPFTATSSVFVQPVTKRIKLETMIRSTVSLTSPSSLLPIAPEMRARARVVGLVASTAGVTFQDVGIQVDSRSSRRMCPEQVIKTYKSKFRGCKKQMQRLERRVMALKERLAESSKLQPNALQHKKVDAIVCSAKEGSRRASFLLEQINAFGQSKPRWQANTVRLCTVWQQRFPKGYRFVRNANLLTLPHEATLKRFEENSLRFEDAAPLVSMAPKFPDEIDCDHQQLLRANASSVEEQPVFKEAAVDDSNAAFTLPLDAAHVMLVDNVGKLLECDDEPHPATVAITSDESLSDEHQLIHDHQVLIESVPLSLLQPRHLGPMGELSLANQELIRNFLLAHGGGHVTLTEVDGDDGGTTCCLVHDLAFGDDESVHDHLSLPAQLLATERELLEPSPTSDVAVDGGLAPVVHRCVLEAASALDAFREQLMLSGISDPTSDCLSKEDGSEGVLQGRESGDPDGSQTDMSDADLLHNVGEVFCSDGDAILEL